MNDHPAARLDPATIEQADPEVQEIFGRLRAYGEPDNPVIGTLMLHPRLAELYLPFSDFLKNHGVLSGDQRRLLIMRTAWNCGADYQWVAHARYAQNAGVAADIVRRIAAGPDDPGWSQEAKLLLQAADELHLQCLLSDQTWAGLQTVLDEAQLVELIMLVGNYRMVAYLMSSIRILPATAAPSLPGHSFHAPGEDVGSV